MGKSRLVMMLVTSLDIMLLENGVLNIVSIVQTKIFTLKRFNLELSKCSATHASRSSSECSCGFSRR